MKTAGMFKYVWPFSRLRELRNRLMKHAVVYPVAVTKDFMKPFSSLKKSIDALERSIEYPPIK